MKKTILAFGEVLWDILPSCTVLGGAPFNFVYRVNSLGDTGLMISRLGGDELGRKAHEQIVRSGLDTQFMQWDDELPTGTVQVSFDEQNNPDYVIVPDVAYDRIETSEELLAAASKADCLCFGTLSQRAGQSRRAIERLLEEAVGSLKLLDINLRKQCYSLETVTSSLEKADVLKLNEDEALALGRMLDISHDGIPQFCTQIMDKWSVKQCLVTLGEKGAFAASADGQQVYAPGYRVELADSLGSGDAFTAGFVHKSLRGENLAAACEFGNVIGAIVATQTGATAALGPEDIDAFMQQSVERIVHPGFEDFANS
ncbi:MAG: carbohydrate kinase family protein [Planctomycetota bacterium]|jgi:fructokinase